MLSCSLNKNVDAQAKQQGQCPQRARALQLFVKENASQFYAGIIIAKAGSQEQILKNKNLWEYVPVPIFIKVFLRRKLADASRSLS